MCLLKKIQQMLLLKEGEKMTNTKLLKAKIKEKGVKKGFLVKALNTSYHWLGKKIENEKEFKASEIETLCEVLGITDNDERNEIFFAKNVEKSST
jgi:hypothetical protein